MEHPKRGEVWLTDFEPAVGSEIKKQRPALIVSNDIFNRKTSKVTVLPLTSQVKPLPITVVVQPDKKNNLDKPSLIKIPDISTFDKARLQKKLGIVNDSILKDVDKKLKTHLGIQ